MRLLADDALMTMPPEPVRVCGERGIGAFLVSGPLSDPARRFESHLTRLNGQPAIALYRGAEVGAFRPYGVLVLSIRGKSIASITRFAGPGLFQRLDLPPAATETLRRRSG